MLPAALAFGLLMAVSATGYHRDELYFLEASHHMAWGYVDQPPLSIAIVWASRTLFGESLVGLRLFPALADAGTVVLTGLIAKELGGSRFAQTLSALSIAVSPFLIAGHLAGPTIYDILAWTWICFLMIRLIRTRDTRLWLAVGPSVGIALLNKETVLLLVGGLTIGFVVTRQLKMYFDRWLAAGVAIAITIWSPVLIWEARNGWPTLTMSRNLQQEHSGFGYAQKFIPIQILLPGWWVAPVWLCGLWSLLKRPALTPYRPFAIAYLLGSSILLVVIPDRPYYIAGLFPVLMAAGAPVAEDVISGVRRFMSQEAPRHRFVWTSQRRALTFVTVAGLLFVPLALPVLPASVLASLPLQNVNYNLGEVVGWPGLVRTVASVYDSLPSSERAHAVIFTSNYGEAGAIDRFGPALGLPQAWSGHNNFWMWGPPRTRTSASGPVLVVGYTAGQLGAWFDSVTRSATIDTGVSDDEQGQPVWLCEALKHPWPVIWPQLEHFG